MLPWTFLKIPTLWLETQWIAMNAGLSATGFAASRPKDTPEGALSQSAWASKSKAFAPLRSSLIKKGMIYSPSHGDTAFTVPLFDQFMLRTMPDGPRRAMT